MATWPSPLPPPSFLLIPQHSAATVASMATSTAPEQAAADLTYISSRTECYSQQQQQKQSTMAERLSIPASISAAAAAHSAPPSSEHPAQMIIPIAASHQADATQETHVLPPPPPTLSCQAPFLTQIPLSQPFPKPTPKKVTTTLNITTIASYLSRLSRSNSFLCNLATQTSSHQALSNTNLSCHRYYFHRGRPPDAPPVADHPMTPQLELHRCCNPSKGQ